MYCLILTAMLFASSSMAVTGNLSIKILWACQRKRGGGGLYTLQHPHAANQPGCSFTHPKWDQPSKELHGICLNRISEGLRHLQYLLKIMSAKHLQRHDSTVRILAQSTGLDKMRVHEYLFFAIYSWLAVSTNSPDTETLLFATLLIAILVQHLDLRLPWRIAKWNSVILGGCVPAPPREPPMPLGRRCCWASHLYPLFGAILRAG